MTMHCTSNLLGRKKKKNDPTIERGKILIQNKIFYYYFGGKIYQNFRK
jgi:hypothetical protein